MKPTRRLLRSLLICGLALILTLSAALIVSAHPGNTDAQGGHRVRGTGEYHYHHGEHAHSHEDMDGDGDLDCTIENHTFFSNTHSFIDVVIVLIQATASALGCGIILNYIFQPILWQSKRFKDSNKSEKSVGLVFWVSTLVSFIVFLYYLS